MSKADADDAEVRRSTQRLQKIGTNFFKGSAAALPSASICAICVHLRPLFHRSERREQHILRFAQDDNRAAPALSSAVPFSRPDFKSPELASVPDARFVAAPADGVLPDGFFSTTNLPTYVRIKGEWRLPREPHMDSALVLDRYGALWVKQGRRLRKGDLVAVGAAEDC